MNTFSQQLLTLREAENLTGRKVSTWRKDIYEKRIGCVRIRRQVRIPIEEIQRLINEGYTPPSQ